MTQRDSKKLVELANIYIEKMRETDEKRIQGLDNILNAYENKDFINELLSMKVGEILEITRNEHEYIQDYRNDAQHTLEAIVAVSQKIHEKNEELAKLKPLELEVLKRTAPEAYSSLLRAETKIREDLERMHRELDFACRCCAMANSEVHQTYARGYFAYARIQNMEISEEFYKHVNYDFSLIKEQKQAMKIISDYTKELHGDYKNEAVMSTKAYNGIMEHERIERRERNLLARQQKEDIKVINRLNKKRNKMADKILDKASGKLEKKELWENRFAAVKSALANSKDYIIGHMPGRDYDELKAIREEKEQLAREEHREIVESRNTILANAKAAALVGNDLVFKEELEKMGYFLSGKEAAKLFRTDNTLRIIAQRKEDIEQINERMQQSIDRSKEYVNMIEKLGLDKLYTKTEIEEKSKELNEKLNRDVGSFNKDLEKLRSVDKTNMYEIKSNEQEIER